jgi:hypothetical protein
MPGRNGGRHSAVSPGTPRLKETSMRILALLTLALGTLLATSNAQAQTYDPSYPVCLHVYGRNTYYKCGYTSLAQCGASASGRAAQCVVNPYFAAARVPAPTRRYRRHHHDVY